MSRQTTINDPSLLFTRLVDLKDQIKDMQSEIKVIQNTIIDMYQDQTDAKLASEGKDFGQASVEDGDYKITIDKRKSVKWDQAKLKSILDLMDPDTAAHYAKVDVSVPEAKYATATPDIKGALSMARTVELQGTTVSIKKIGE
jgi:TolA-binding protein